MDLSMLSTNRKNANGKKWYKDNCDFFDTESYSFRTALGYGYRYRELQTNYDLYNGKFNKEYYSYVCERLGVAKDKDNKIADQIKHLDIVSNKINKLLGQKGSGRKDIQSHDF